MTDGRQITAGVHHGLQLGGDHVVRKADEQVAEPVAQLFQPPAFVGCESRPARSIADSWAAVYVRRLAMCSSNSLRVMAAIRIALVRTFTMATRHACGETRTRSHLH